MPGAVAGDTVTYTGVQPGVNLELRATGNGVKENLIVASAAAGNTWTFPLTLDKLTVRAGGADSVDLIGADGKVAATIPTGIVHDSKFDAQPGGFEQATEARYSVITVAGHPALQVSVDPAWLADPARVYPVVVDPSVSQGNNANVDTDVRNDRTSDQNGDTEMSIGNNGASPAVKAYSFLRFDSFYSNFTNVNITAASLNLWDSWAGGHSGPRVEAGGNPIPSAKNDGGTSEDERNWAQTQPCHTCGRTADELPSAPWGRPLWADHQEPTQLGPKGGNRLIYSQCWICGGDRSKGVTQGAKILIAHGHDPEAEGAYEILMGILRDEPHHIIG